MKYKTIDDQTRMLNSIKKVNSCWEWQKSLNSGGYGRIIIGSRIDNTRKIVTAHRYSYQLFVGKIPKDKWVLHKCDNRKCINPDHLFIGTRQDNVDDRQKKNKNKPIDGELNPNCKHTINQINEIKKLYSEGKYTMRELASMYGYKNHQSIFYIIHNKRWKLPELPK